MTDEERQSIPPFEEPEDESPERRERRRRIERLLRDAVRGAVEKGLEAGLETISKTDRAIRGVVGGELPRELAGYVFQQVDETKNTLVRVVAKEVRDFLEATDLADVLQRALTSLSFEVRMQVRFVPNDAGGLRPSVKAVGGPRRERRRRREQAGSAPSEPPADASVQPEAEPEERD